MKQITTPELDLALKALELAQAECKFAAEQNKGLLRQRDNAPRPVLTALGHVALTTVQNKKRTQQMAQRRARVEHSKGGVFGGQKK